MAEFNQLLISNIEYLKPYAVVFTHDSESAKDLLQETLCRALANRAHYGFLFACIMKDINTRKLPI